MKKLAVNLDEIATAFEYTSLAKNLVTAPPLELWPQVIARVPIPQDVEQGLISLLA